MLFNDLSVNHEVYGNIFDRLIGGPLVSGMPEPMRSWHMQGLIDEFSRFKSTLVVRSDNDNLLLGASSVVIVNDDGFPEAEGSPRNLLANNKLSLDPSVERRIVQAIDLASLDKFD